MTRFDRSFATDTLTSFLDACPLVARLFAEWQLPGPDAPTTRFRLRLAVRAGYLNFYARGQSVAKLSLVRGSPRLTVHRKYLGDDVAAGRRSGEYVALDGAALAALPAARLDSWMDRALGKTGAEKRFVDDLVTANAGTIDLEMALPGDPRRTRTICGKDGVERERMTAPRMDLVVLQPGANGLDLAFWEAKCADNGELRAEGNTPPPLLEQLTQYREWLMLKTNQDGPDRGAEVLAAYARAAATLEALAHAAGKPDGAARRLWREASQDGVGAIVQPGIVIGNYCADGDAARNVELRRNAETFVAKGHDRKLIGYRVQAYVARPDAPLPLLAGDRIGA